MWTKNFSVVSLI